MPLSDDITEEHPTKSIYRKLVEEVKNKPLLPQYGGEYIKADDAAIAGTEEIRKLFSSDHLDGLHWLKEGITRDNNPKLRNFLKNELGIREFEWESIIPELGKDLLEEQSDDWICRFYEALTSQRALKGQLKKCPLIRLEDKTHISLDTVTEIFLPPKNRDSGFQTVRLSVCKTEKSLEFLKGLGLSEPDEVDDIIKNTLSKYKDKTTKHSDEEYKKDIEAILRAYKTDSGSKKEKLRDALKESYFVKAIDHNNNSTRMAKPDEVYRPIENLKELFSNIPDILFLNDSYSCLKGEPIRDIIRACGVAESLRPVEIKNPDWISLDEKRKMQDRRGKIGNTKDYVIHGLEKMLEQFSNLNTDECRKKGELLWKDLAGLQENKFKGIHQWSYYHYTPKTGEKLFDAKFLKQLKETAWMMNKEGELKKPNQVNFSSLGWEPRNDELADHLGMMPDTYTADEVSEMMKAKDKKIEELEAQVSELEHKGKQTTTDRTQDQSYSNDKLPPIMGRAKAVSPTTRDRKTSENDTTTSSNNRQDENKQFEPSEENKETGRRGEKIVYTMLCEKHGKENITWHNEGGEAGNSYDISINNNGTKIYVEVKTAKEKPSTQF